MLYITISLRNASQTLLGQAYEKNSTKAFQIRSHLPRLYYEMPTLPPHANPLHSTPVQPTVLPSTPTSGSQLPPIPDYTDGMWALGADDVHRTERREIPTRAVIPVH